MMRGRDLICVSSLDWDAHWGCVHQIMSRLAQANRILYVEEPVTMLAPLRVRRHWLRWRAAVPAVRRASAGVWILTPPPLLPFGNVRPWVNKLNQRVLGFYIRWASRRLGFTDPMLWTYLPTSIDLLDRVASSAVVYHCVDEHSAFPGFVSREVVKGYDDALTARADLVITTAANLRDSRAHLNPRVHHVPNAADAAHFGAARDPALPLPADVASLPTPRIGVVGIHDERLDVAAIEAIARHDPDWTVLVVGPLRPGDVDEARLRACPNVHVLGARLMSELPAYLKAMDVALIPYKLDELTRNIFPLKIYEYLAAGLPVVSAALPELAGIGNDVLFAKTPAEYPALVVQALAEDSAARRAARVAFAARNTWDDRVEAISHLVEGMLSERASAAAPAAEGRAVEGSAGAPPAPPVAEPPADHPSDEDGA
ncbi:MAG TPA: glycosyltransferase [Thermoleophilia bacterium]|nr:glycosyltransferase [Thermoleophilia bacterium]